MVLEVNEFINLFIIKKKRKKSIDLNGSKQHSFIFYYVYQHQKGASEHKNSISFETE